MTLPPDFPWRPGMLATRPDCRPVRLSDIEDGGNALQEGGWLPDPNDGSTLGALLEAVREAYRDPLAHAWPTEDQEGLELTRWYVRVPAVYGSRAIGQGDTEFDALLAAWNARPVKP